MEVVFDDQVFVRQRRGGISRYFVELMERIPRVTEGAFSVSRDWKFTINEHALEAGYGRELRIPGSSLIGDSVQARIAAAANSAIRRQSGAVVHSTYYARPPEEAARGGTRLATTIFDMTPERFPELFPKGNPHLLKEKYVRESDLVIFISESTRRDVLDIYGDVPAKCVVIPWGYGSEFTLSGPTHPGLPGEYVLFVGQRAGYKDFAVLVDAMRQAASGVGTLPLVLVGGGPISSSEQELLRGAGLLESVLQLSPRDDELPGVYRGASVFVFPSRYEGFGLPTLEAMACGTPTVLARSSSHIEVGGDAARFFSPTDAQDLGAVLSEVLVDSELREQMKNLGLANVKRFDWDTAVKQHAAAYQRIA
jgi:glycosyltransferase involved in cell wall biosynthesis